MSKHILNAPLLLLTCLTSAGCNSCIFCLSCCTCVHSHTPGTPTLSHGVSKLLSCWMQTAAGQSNADGQAVLHCSQHSKQLQEMTALKSTIALLQQSVRDEQNLVARQVADCKRLQLREGQLTKSLQEQSAETAKFRHQLQCLQNNYDMQGAALESKGRQLLEVCLCATAAVSCCPPSVHKTSGMGATTS